jgi:hypothetical protein
MYMCSRGVLSAAIQETPRILEDVVEPRVRWYKSSYIHSTEFPEKIHSLFGRQQRPLTKTGTGRRYYRRHGRKVLGIVRYEVNISLVDEHIIQYGIPLRRMSGENVGIERTTNQQRAFEFWFEERLSATADALRRPTLRRTPPPSPHPRLFG